MKGIISLLTLLLVMSCSTAQNAAVSKKITTSENDDDRIVHEYLQVTGAKANMLKFREIMLTQMRNNLEKILGEELNSAQFKDQAVRGNAAILVNDAITRFVERYKVEQSKLMPFEDLEQKIIGPIIRKHFSTEELISLISFYKTPLGKKYISSVDSVMMEITKDMNKEYGQKLYNLSKTIAEEELGDIKRQLLELQAK